MVRESEGACFGASVKEHGDRCRAKGFESWKFVVFLAAPAMIAWFVEEVAHVYVYDAGLVEDCFPDEKTDLEGKVGEHFENEDDFGLC